MKIKMLYFAEVKRIVKKNSEQIKFNGKNCRDLEKVLLATYPSVSKVLKNSMFSVNLEYAQEDTSLKDGDTVAIIPPVEGG